MLWKKPILAALPLLILASSVSARPLEARTTEVRPETLANANRKAAGRLRNGVLAIKREARRGLWRPETKDGPSLAMRVFGEGGFDSPPSQAVVKPASNQRITVGVTRDFEFQPK